VASTGTLSAKSLLPLAPFTYDWVGGDIHGLAALAGTLYGYVPEFNDVVTALDKQVSRIVGDAGWQGKAASAFTQNWERISAETNAVGLVTINTGSIVDQLAQQLSEIENALEQAADQTTAHGVPIGSDGQPPQACYANQTQEEWAEGYASFYQQCMAAADNARNQAAGALQSMYTSVTSPKDGGGSSLSTKVGEGATVGDYITDLLATRTAYANEVADKVADLTKEAEKAQQAWLAAQKAARGADGRFGKMPDDVKQALSKANEELDSENAALKTAKADETAWSKLFGTRLEDLPGLSGIADELGESSLLDRALGKVFDLPVVDVVAGGVGTYLNAQADIKAGVPAWAAYPLETGGTIASFAAADAAADVVGGLVGGLSVAGAPVLGVVAGTAAAGIVAYGVGDYIHNYIADFGQQWHEHGVLGIVTDFGAAGVSTFDDTKQLVGDVGHAADSVWHGITSLF
jgi:uncharacterized protein YukE